MQNAITHGVMADNRRPAAWFDRGSALLRSLQLLALLLFITGCNHRVASEGKLDVCDMAHDVVARFLVAPEQTPGRSPAPAAGTCDFSSGAHQKGEVVVSVHVFTKAAFEAGREDFEQTLRVILAEASQTFGPVPSADLSDTAKVGIGYILEGSSSQVILSERGVLLEIGVHGLPRDRILDLSRDLWRALLAYKPRAPSKAEQISR